jgi:hypothetical protein
MDLFFHIGSLAGGLKALKVSRGKPAASPLSSTAAGAMVLPFNLSTL